MTSNTAARRVNGSAVALDTALLSLTVVIAVTSLAAAAARQQTSRLHASDSVAATIAGEESHAYAITLAADQYLGVTVEQRGLDVTLSLVGPDGTTLAEADGVRAGQGTETLAFIADGPGDHRLVVRAAAKNAPRGGYRATVVALRPPTEIERTMERARRLTMQARDLRHKGKYAEAQPPAEQALALYEAALGPHHVTVADALHLVALLLDDRHDYDKAGAPNRRALAIRERTLGPDHPDVARSLFNLAWLAKVKQDFAAAESLYRRALDIQERALGPGHPDVATTLNDMAVLYNQQGDFDASIAINERVLWMREAALGPDDPGVAKALNNLARGHELKGDAARASALLQRSLAIWEKALGPDHPEVAFAVDGLARVYHASGDYAAAEPLYVRALAIREKALGPDHTEVATTLNNLALLYRQKGDYAKAEPLVLRDLAITEKGLGPTHAFMAPSVSNLATIYELQGDDRQAEPLYQRALRIQETALGPEHASVGVTLSRLGRLYARGTVGEPGQAEALLQRAVTVLEKAVGPNHPGIAGALGGLSTLAEGRGDLVLAEQLQVRALAVQETSVGSEHPDVADALERLAFLRSRAGDTQHAVTLLSRAYDIRERHLAHNLPLGSERQKVGYVALFAGDTDSAMSLHADAPKDISALRLAFTTLLRRKGRALEAASDSVAALRANAAPADRALFDRLSRTRAQLAALTLRGPSGPSPAYRAQLGRLRDDVDQLETDIGARSAAFRAALRPVTLEGVQAALPADTVLVEFARYRPSDRTSLSRHARYAAYTLAAVGDPQWVDLGEAVAIDRAVEAWRAALRDPRRTDTSRLARAVDTRILQPVRGLVGQARHLVISPDGPLNLIPFAALVDERGDYLVNRYAITYLTSGRDLLRLQVPRQSRSAPVVVAAPAFGDPALVTGTRAQVDYSQAFFGPLPGVGDEVRALEKFLPQATFLLGARATEAALRQVAGPRILHVATHGFFLPSEPPSGNTQPLDANGTRVGRWAAWTDNPLLRSGLALAGANQGRSGDDEGVLTALEAAGLDLWGTKLVVLSACDTGVGVVKEGDGVYGLRRALVLAGAESQVMSLWAVSDRSTRDLMIGYYTRLEDGEGRGEALRQVQRQMLRTPRHAHSYYWASFIQSGQWTSLGLEH